MTTINTAAELDLWLDGFDSGRATTLRTLADLTRSVPPERLAAVINHLAGKPPARKRRRK